MYMYFLKKKNREREEGEVFMQYTRTHIHTYIHTYIYIYICVCVCVCTVWLLIYPMTLPQSPSSFSHISIGCRRESVPKRKSERILWLVPHADGRSMAKWTARNAKTVELHSPAALKSLWQARKNILGYGSCSLDWGQPSSYRRRLKPRKACGCHTPEEVGHALWIWL